MSVRVSCLKVISDCFHHCVSGALTESLTTSISLHFHEIGQERATLPVLVCIELSVYNCMKMHRFCTNLYRDYNLKDEQ